ncbi:MAG: hypothetical protein ACO3JI_06050, partial [Steroidobacteraceae bacterium]
MKRGYDQNLGVHVWIVGLVAAVLFLLALFDGDLLIARQLFFDTAAQEWVGRHDWWANELLHTGGRNLMRLVGVLAILT